MLAGGFTDDGQWLDDEYVADLLDLFCSDEGAAVTIDETKFEQHLSEHRVHLERGVQGRNSVLRPAGRTVVPQPARTAGQSQRKDPRIQRPKKGKPVRTLATPTTRCSNQVKEGGPQKWAERAEDEDEARVARKTMRAEADHYLDLIEQGTRGTQVVEHLFSIRWTVGP